MTPQQLRENARQNLVDARALLPRSPKNAAYLAGYAVEFVLKARYCSLRKWPLFPANVNELIAWNKRDGVQMADKLFVHDLEALLRLSETVQLKASAFQRIDWDRACDWSEQIRYQAADSITQSDAEALIAEAEKIVDELAVFEVVESLRSIEVELTRRYGLFHCFAFVVHPETKRWMLLAAWYAQSPEEWDLRARELELSLDASLAPDLRDLISEIVTVDPQLPVLRGLYVMLTTIGGRGILHSPRSIFAGNIVVGYPKMPDGFIITAGNWSPESVKQVWAEASELTGGEAGADSESPS